MNLTATRIQIEALTRELHRGWDDARLDWRDFKATEFEARLLPELDTRVGKALAAIEKLDRLLTQIRGDCE
jgi:hypothetical protein